MQYFYYSRNNTIKTGKGITRGSLHLQTANMYVWVGSVTSTFADKTYGWVCQEITNNKRHATIATCQYVMKSKITRDSLHLQAGKKKHMGGVVRK